VYLTVRNFLRSMIKNWEGRNLIRGIPVFLIQNAMLKPLGVLIVGRDPRMAVTFYSAIAWNLQTLKEQIYLRDRIQKNRVLSDEAIMKRMGEGGYEPFGRFLHRARVVADQEYGSRTS